jgi:hypothetical protein
MASFYKIPVHYPGHRIVEEVYIKHRGENAILIMLWRKNEGGTYKNFSRQDASLYYLTAAITSGIPPLSS